jgi:hypothetical protein
MADEAGKKENENSVNQKPQTEPLTIEAPEKKKHGCLRWFGILAGIYILLTLWMQWTPPVRGVVVDAETGKPIPGVEIIRQGYGGAISGIGIVSTAGCKKTDENGRFSIWGTLKSTMSTWWSYFVPIWAIDKVDLYIYHPDYISSFTEVKIGKIGLTDRVVTRRESFEEKRLLYESMKFKIKLVKAQTERDWSEKCDQAIRSYMNFQDRHGVDEWLFNDLVKYLERYPNGNKAGEYLSKAVSVSLVKYEENEEATKEDQAKFAKEARSLLDLANKVSAPKEPWGEKVGYELNLKELRRELSKAEQLLEKKEKK